MSEQQESNPELLKKRDRLFEILKNLGSVAVAFSGGVDSATLLKAAVLTLGREKALGVTVQGVIFPAHEIETAVRVAKVHNLPHRLVELSPLDLDKFRENPSDRCYHCKKFLFGRMMEFARSEGYDHVLEGGNADDTSDYRPGIKAVRELGAQAPLREAGLEKKEIRALALSWGLENWNMASAACLASRVPYGVEITAEAMARIDQAETFLRETFQLSNVRVRDDGTSARIELPSERIENLARPENREKIISRLSELGYRYISIDLTGYRMGSWNESLK